MPVSYPGVQYSGIWNISSQANAKAAGTWPSQPVFLYEWGLNTSGQLGTGNTTNYSSPKQVGSVTGTPRKFITKGTSTWLIKNDYSLWAWGANSNGQLGIGTSANTSSPSQVGALTNWLDIAAAYHAVSIKTDGTMWSWGYNGFGALGLNNTTNYSSPKQVGALTTWSKVAVGTYHTLAIKTDGTLWSWGYNASYQLGLSNQTYYSSPKQVGSLTNWLSVSASFYTSGAIKTDGTLWMWARNNNGQQGISSGTDPVTSPRQVGALTTWSKIRCSGNFTTAIKTDGTLWAWGANTYGQLGTNNTTTYQSPIQVGALTTWSDVDVNNGTGNATIGFKTDGTIWSWGRNQFGQLGLGNTTNYSSPKQVGSLTNWLSISSGPYATAAFPS